MDPNIKAQMNDRIRKVIKERTGPSFDERVAVAASKRQKETKKTEDAQKEVIEAAIARAKARPCESATRSKELIPPSIEEWGKDHARIRRTNEAAYAKADAERKWRMDNREPLFKLSEVAAAFDMQNQRKRENMAFLQDQENKQWDHLRELQERVLHRPLLIEDPSGAGGSGHQAEEPEEKDNDPNWKAKFQAKMTKRIQQTIKERSGPSFEERVQVRASKFRKEAKATRDTQLKVIEAAITRAKARPTESPFRTKEETPPSIEEWAKKHKQTRADNEAMYAEEYAQRKYRMDTREPLFRVSEVQAAFEMQNKRQLENKRKLRKMEQDRWNMLQSMQQRVVHRPLLVEHFERPVHAKSEPELRLIPNHTKPMNKDISIKKCVSQPWFLESAWGKEVATFKERMDNRPKLHEIAYPPKEIKEKPPPAKFVTPLDKRLEEVMKQPWFGRTQWASEVQNIKQRQDDRPKLHEISYPPKER